MNNQIAWVDWLLLHLRSHYLFGQFNGAPSYFQDALGEMIIELETILERLLNDGRLNTREFRNLLELDQALQFVK